MKEPSKLDQIRALREATAQPRKSPPPLPAPTKTFAEMVAEPLPAKILEVVRRNTRVTNVLKSPPPLLARAGDCPSCDRRRALLTAAKAKRRANAKTI